MSTELEQALQAHERALVDRAVTIWVGGEPTFTDRLSAAPQWTFAADGPEKREAAEAIVRELATRFEGTMVLRTLGRQYPDEDQPRWSLGMYRARSGQAIWRGPSDPLAGGLASDSGAAERLRDALAETLQGAGFVAARYDCRAGPLPRRLCFSRPADSVQLPARAKAAWFCRAPVVEKKIGPVGPVDRAAEQGLFVVAIGHHDEPDSQGRATVRLDLPRFGSVEHFVSFCSLLERAAEQASLAGLVVSGYGPPVDETIWWGTVTPDPGVVEVNMAPCDCLFDYWDEQRAIYDAAQRVGLAACRLHFNGEAAGSGGGGHITLGGRTPAESPFLRYPKLLPRLVAYFNRHPALSYWFTSAAGSSSQAPRADEGACESKRELALALYQLEHAPQTDAQVIWRTLAPFMVDRFGNTHRAELNLEKLQNPFLGERGMLGLVEFRAFRMAPTAAHAAAYAALLRTICARLISRDAPAAMIDWGGQLQDRFALPFYLERDLRAVLNDLSENGLGLAPCLSQMLLESGDQEIAAHELGGIRVSLRHAIEFWPLVGDLSKEGTSRIVDPSCKRLQLSLQGSADDVARWCVQLDGRRLPLVHERLPDGVGVGLVGVRYRAFMPQIALHPTVGPRGPLAFVLSRPDLPAAYRMTLHAWRPDGEAYDGLPRDPEEATRRRRERVVVERLDGPLAEPHDPPAQALSDYCVDTRYFVNAEP